MPRGRRLTLAPAVKRALRPSVTQAEDGDSEDEGEEVRRRRSGHEALSREVALAAAVSRRPAPVHGVEPLKSKFWALGEDSDESDVDEAELATATPSTPVFINEALDAGFTIEQLAMAEQALDSGISSSPTALRLPKVIVSEMVRRNLARMPWKGPLPGPRVSPPRTLGDFLATANRRHLGSHGGSASSSRRLRSPARPVQARMKIAGSKDFETPEIQGIEPNLPPLPSVALPASVACATPGATGKSGCDATGSAEQVIIRPGKLFRPTKGLCALFRRTGTRHRHRLITKPPPSSSTSARRSFAEVVRAGKAMVAQGVGNDGDFGGRGGGRGAGYNPGFHPGFDSGYTGRGRGRDFHPRGRGRGHGGHGGFGYNSFNSGYRGVGRGERQHSAGYGGGRGCGRWQNPGWHHHQPTAPNQPQQLAVAPRSQSAAAQGGHPAPQTTAIQGGSRHRWRTVVLLPT